MTNSNTMFVKYSLMYSIEMLNRIGQGHIYIFQIKGHLDMTQMAYIRSTVVKLVLIRFYKK